MKDVVKRYTYYVHRIEYHYFKKEQNYKIRSNMNGIIEDHAELSQVEVVDTELSVNM